MLIPVAVAAGVTKVTGNKLFGAGAGLLMGGLGKKGLVAGAAGYFEPELEAALGNVTGSAGVGAVKVYG